MDISEFKEGLEFTAELAPGKGRPISRCPLRQGG